MSKKKENNPKMVKRFSKVIIAAHWLNALAFFMLYLTGLPLYTETFDWLYTLYGGPAGGRLLHRIAGVTFLVPTVLVIALDPKGFLHWMKQIFSWKAHDFAFFPKFVKEFFTGHADVPKQDFYNAGEKVNSLLVILTSVMLIGTGFIMWFPQFFAQGIVMWSYPIHNISFGLAAAVIVGHIYLSVGHPNSRPAMQGILKGEIPEDYAKEHHGLWHDELMEQEKAQEQEQANKKKRA